MRESNGGMGGSARKGNSVTRCDVDGKKEK